MCRFKDRNATIEVPRFSHRVKGGDNGSILSKSHPINKHIILFSKQTVVFYAESDGMNQYGDR